VGAAPLTGAPPSSRGPAGAPVSALSSSHPVDTSTKITRARPFNFQDQRETPESVEI
jgi:hypothetical protein